VLLLVQVTRLLPAGGTQLNMSGAAFQHPVQRLDVVVVVVAMAPRSGIPHRRERRRRRRLAAVARRLAVPVLAIV
jgi:hypothetical protein